MFEGLDMAPPDAILGLAEAFKKDPHPDKINLTAGVYKDASGNTPVLETVKKAETKIVREESTKNYLSIEGSPEYAEAVQHLLFGPAHEIVRRRRAVTVQTPGGTGALRIAAEFIKQLRPNCTVWLSDPTWPNHPGVFKAAGLNTAPYAYYDMDSKSLDFEKCSAALKGIPNSDVVLLHACCHNPSGMDPTLEQWKSLAAVASECGFLPFFDFAYQGFGDGLDEDARGMREFCTEGAEVLIASSFSKNFGLYRERVGALTLVAKTEDDAQKTLSHLRRVVRTTWSNPPSHGAAVVTTILRDGALRNQWEQEVAGMRNRIHGMRRLFVETLGRKGVKQDFLFLTTQRGMFSFSGLSREQVLKLRNDYGIYAVDSGRINVAAMTEDTMEPLCDAIARVLSA